MANFGSFAVVNAGQRGGSVKPELICSSTPGTFRLTGPAAKALGIAPNEYVMFLQTPDGTYAIGKGNALKKSDGTPLMCNARVNKEEYVKANFDAVSAAFLASDKLTDEEKEAFSAASEAEQIAMLAEHAAPLTQKYNGSKSANTSGLTGLGAGIVFTDNNIWHQLMADLKGEKKVRHFAINPDDAENFGQVEVKNGYDSDVVTIAVLGESYDTDPTRFPGAKDEAEDEGEDVE